MCYWAPPAAISQKWALRAGQQTHTLVLISKEQLCSALVNISSLSIVVWWFKIAWPKWLLSIIGLTVCVIKRRCVLLQILCFRLHTHFLVPTVSKDPLLCALNKQSLFEVELPESSGRRWWRMREEGERERKREMIYLMKAELDECDRTVISQFPAVSGGKDMVSHSHLHTQFVLSITACKCTSYFPSVINRRVYDFVLVCDPGECLLYRMFGNSLCHVFVTTCVHCKHFRRVCGNI